MAELRDRLAAAETVLAEVRRQYQERVGGELPLIRRETALTRRNTCDPAEVWEYINGLERLGMRLGLERVTKLVEALGSPQKAYRTIHVVGTNGKSSTTRFISSMLEAQGLQGRGVCLPASDQPG